MTERTETASGTPDWIITDIHIYTPTHQEDGLPSAKVSIGGFWVGVREYEDLYDLSYAIRTLAEEYEELARKYDET